MTVMPASDHKVRVFISSTFRDMHAERDHLVTVVFPELRERCERLGLEFFDVDLRWGVPEKTVDGETANSWEYCRQWIDRVEPFFIGILGQRYGWVPPPEKLKDEADRARQLQDPRSITDMEVRYGVLDSRLKRRSCFYLRTTLVPELDANVSDEAKELHAGFVDTGKDADKLKALQNEVRASDRPVRNYPCQWTGTGFNGMEEFGAMVLEDLWSGVLRDERYVSKDVWRQVLGTDPDADPRYTDEKVAVPVDIAEQIIPLAKPPPKNPLEAEREQMEIFAASRLRWFQGRTKELDQLTAFISDPAEDNKPRLALIAAVPGQGKSALMAKLWESLQPKETKEGKKDTASPSLPVSSSPSLFIVAHFVGTTSQSSSSYNLVKRLNDELDNSGITFPEPPTPEGQTNEEPKLDFQSLCQRLWDRLGDYAGEKRIVILLDALNQLDDGHELGWLPYRLGPSVRIVVSYIEEADKKMDGKNKDSESLSAPHFSASNAEASPATKVLTALDSRHPKPKRIPLGPLTAEDVHTIVTSYLKEYCKELDAPHVDAICDETKLPQARNPLYLLVMLAELRTLGGNDMNQHVPALIAELGTKHPDTVSLFHWVLERLEKAEGFSEQAVRWWCLYLALGRVGMSSRELSDLLVRKLGPDSAATAQRIERALRRYLQRRGEQWDFFHGQLRQAVMERCGGEQRIVQGHREIADYFRAIADPAGDKSWKGESKRPFNELAPHLIAAEQWNELCAYLTDLECLDRRIRDGQVFVLVTDQRAAIAVVPEFAEEARQERERVEKSRRYGDALIANAHHGVAGNHFTLPAPPISLRSESECEFLEVHSPRAIRLRSVANFVTKQASLLSARSDLFLLLAANEADDRALDEATDLLSARGQPWISRLHRQQAPSLRPQLSFVLIGHDDWVTCVTLTPDGRYCVSGSSDNTIRVWDLMCGECLRVLIGHTNVVRSVYISPDGQRVVSSSDDDTIRVWIPMAGQCIKTIECAGGGLLSLSVTPDCRRAISGGSVPNSLRVWDLENGKCVHSIDENIQSVFGVEITPDCRRAVFLSSDNTLRVWDLESNRCLQTLQVPLRRFSRVSVTPDGRQAVSGCSDNTLQIWNLESGECLRILNGHTDAILGVSVTPDFQIAVSCSDDNTVRVWDVESGQCMRVFQGHDLWICGVSISADGHVIASASADKTLRIWNLHCGPMFGNRVVYPTLIGCLSPVANGPQVASGSFNNTVQIWDINSGQCVQVLAGHSHSVNCICVTSDGYYAVSGSHDKSLRVWNLRDGQCLKILQGHTGGVECVQVTPDGMRVISGGFPNTIRIWDLDNGDCRRVLLGHSLEVTSLCLTHDGACAISASADCTLRLWELESGQCLMCFEGHCGSIHAVCITPDGRRAVSGSSDKTLRVWDIETGQCVRTLNGHADVIRCVIALATRRTLVSGSSDNTLRFWDLSSGHCLAVYYAGAEVLAVAASSNDEFITCSTMDGQMHFLTLKNFPEVEQS